MVGSTKQTKYRSCEWQSQFKWHFPFNQGLQSSNGAKVNTGNEKPTGNRCTLRAANSMIQ